jgi:hypothetical protein
VDECAPSLHGPEPMGSLKPEAAAARPSPGQRPPRPRLPALFAHQLSCCTVSHTTTIAPAAAGTLLSHCSQPAIEPHLIFNTYFSPFSFLLLQSSPSFVSYCSVFCGLNHLIKSAIFAFACFAIGPHRTVRHLWTYAATPGYHSPCDR